MNPNSSPGDRRLSLSCDKTVKPIPNSTILPDLQRRLWLFGPRQRGGVLTCNLGGPELQKVYGGKRTSPQYCLLITWARPQLSRLRVSRPQSHMGMQSQGLYTLTANCTMLSSGCGEPHSHTLLCSAETQAGCVLDEG